MGQHCRPGETIPALTYHGRFAPSPTGPLHFGSLISAVASYARARSLSGRWSVRMENTDHTREVTGAARQILSQLESFGMVSDTPVIFQRERYARYGAVLAGLKTRGLAYDCGCTRKALDEKGRYPGICRDGLPHDAMARAVRLLTPDEVVAFEDTRLGCHGENVWQQAGDFAVLRADGVYAYQLVVVVDDADLGITEVVRGIDILTSTPRQILLQRYLGVQSPAYLHHPVAVHAPGHKLSKSEGSATISGQNPVNALMAAWEFLGQSAPPGLPRSVAEFWAHAERAFRLEQLPKENEIIWRQGIQPT